MLVWMRDQFCCEFKVGSAISYCLMWHIQDCSIVLKVSCVALTLFGCFWGVTCTCFQFKTFLHLLLMFFLIKEEGEERGSTYGCVDCIV